MAAPLSLVRTPSHNVCDQNKRMGREAMRRVEGRMSDKIYEVSTEWKQRALVKEADYNAMYEHSLKDPDGFWAEQAKRIYWYKAPTRIKNASYSGGVSIKCYEDGITNVA